MEITPEMSALVEKLDVLGNLGHVLIFWMYSGVNKVSVVGTGGLQKECFSTFSRVFLRTFLI